MRIRNIYFRGTFITNEFVLKHYFKSTFLFDNFHKLVCKLKPITCNLHIQFQKWIENKKTTTVGL